MKICIDKPWPYNQEALFRNQHGTEQNVDDNTTNKHHEGNMLQVLPSLSKSWRPPTH